MGLPDNAANPSPYILLGALPIEHIINKKRLGMLGCILRKEDSKEHSIAYRQLATKSIHDKSWFQQTEKLLHKYKLPSAHTLLQNMPPKVIWKAAVAKAVEDYASTTLKQECKIRSSMKYLNYDCFEVGKPHPLWSTVSITTRDVQRAAIKAKIITGTYTLQANRARFNQFEDSSCPLCEAECEDYHHFIMTCPALKQTRDHYLEEIHTLFKRNKSETKWYYIIEDRRYSLQCILDASKLQWLIGNQLPIPIESISRRLCYALHLTRSTLVALRAKNTNQKKQNHKKKRNQRRLL